MKKDGAFKNILGLSQEEAAYLFGIERGQWSMFVSGKRKLPATAMMQLAVVVQHLKETTTACPESEALAKAEQQKAHEKLLDDYRKVQTRLHTISKQIHAIEKIRTECFAALEVAAFLEQEKELQERSGLATGVRNRAMATLQKHNQYALETLKLKKISLDHLKIGLENSLKAIPKP